MKNLLFKTEDFKLDSTVPTSIGSIVRVNGFDGNEVEAWQISDWNWNYSSLKTEIQLAPNSEYIYCFWLNGGENDRYDEVCNVEIWFGSDWENRITVKLNRDHFMPALVKNGWYLFCVPFKTAEEGYTTIRFNGMGAVMTIAPADNPVTYEGIEGDVDSNGMPQRPNVVFENGYPDEQNEEAITLKAFGKSIKTTPSQVKKTLKILGGILAVVVVVRGFLRKKKKP